MQKKFPESDEEFAAAFPDEETARRYLLAMRWPEGVECAHCASKRVTPLSTRPEWWSCRDCRGQTSLRSQSVLHGSRRPLRDWLYVIWACARPRPVTEIARALKATRYQTIFAMVHKVRAAMQERAGYELEGPGVHVGFGWFCAAKHAAGDPRDRPRVLVAIAGKESDERPYAKEFRLSSLGDIVLPEAALETVLEAHVAPATTPRVELRPPVWTLVNSEIDAVKRPYLHFLRWITYAFGGVSRGYLGNYLAQFSYVQNRRVPREELLDRVARRAMREIFRPSFAVALEPLVRAPARLAA